MIHICYIIWIFKSPKNFTGMGGAENQLLKIANSVKNEDNINITIFSRKMKNDLAEEEISKNANIKRINTTFIPILSMFIFMFMLFFKVIKLHKSKRINLIHLPLPDLYVFVAFLLRRILKIPVITRVASDELYPYEKHGLWLVNRLIVRSFMLILDGIQTLNSANRKLALELGYPSKKLYLINNGTIIPKEFRKYEQFTNNIVYIGAMRFHPEKQKIEQKNLIFLIDAFYDLIKKNNDIKLILVGDGNFRSKLENKVRDLGLEKKVIFAGYQTNIQKYLLSTDIFINPSWHEGMPNTVIEAMSYGVFLLCSNIHEHRFIIDNNHNGILFDHTSKKDFVQKVLNFYNNKKKSIEIAKNGRNAAIDQFSINKITKLVFDMYSNVCNQFYKK